MVIPSERKIKMYFLNISTISLLAIFVAPLCPCVWTGRD
jgi:hypothetical protein